MRAAFLPIAISWISAWGQAPSNLLTKAPPDVDSALRERVMQFYNFQIEGKFRAAEALVCEDSRDAYYNTDKRQWKNASIVGVKYGEDFRTAKVTTALGTEFVSRGGRAPVVYPLSGDWRVENGAWCLAIPPIARGELVTPFGLMHPGATASAGEPAPAPPKGPRMTPEALLNGVRLNRNEVTLDSAKEKADEIEITNTLDGVVELRADSAPLKGLAYRLSKGRLVKGDVAKLTVAYAPTATPPPAKITVRIHVDPFGQTIPVTVRFTPAAP
jgi:hypothetical protein